MAWGLRMACWIQERAQPSSWVQMFTWAALHHIHMLISRWLNTRLICSKWNHMYFWLLNLLPSGRVCRCTAWSGVSAISRWMAQRWRHQQWIEVWDGALRGRWKAGRISQGRELTSSLVSPTQTHITFNLWHVVQRAFLCHGANSLFLCRWLVCCEPEVWAGVRDAYQ